jgi:hypothetical protein
VDLALVQACDTSASVSPREWKLELDGVAAAFRDPGVIAAIRAGPRRRIAVALMTWADASQPKDMSNWYLIDSAETAEAFARLVEQFPRKPDGGDGIGSALAEAVSALDRSGFEATRKIVDISGDGSETPPREKAIVLPQAISLADASGVTVNGLAIVSDEPNIESYYEAHVVTGPGHFVVRADDYKYFAVAFRKKLLRELSAVVSNGDSRLRMAGR